MSRLLQPATLLAQETCSRLEIHHHPISQETDLHDPARIVSLPLASGQEMATACVSCLQTSDEYWVAPAEESDGISAKP